MDSFEFRALLDLLMCSDPYPADAGEDTIKFFANRISLDYGFSDWIDAYHNHVA